MKKNVKNPAAILLFLLLLLQTSLSLAAESANSAWQKDADIIRLRHLHAYYELLTRYHSITGRWPFQSTDTTVPTYLFIANHDQYQYTRPGPAFAHHEVTMTAFVGELSRVVGPVRELYDPQITPDIKPSFYSYMIRGDSFYLTVNLFNRYPFARPVAAGYNRLTISNHPSDDIWAILPRRLFHNPEYLRLRATPVKKPSFFEEKEKKYRHDSQRRYRHQRDKN